MNNCDLDLFSSSKARVNVVVGHDVLRVKEGPHSVERVDRESTAHGSQRKKDRRMESGWSQWKPRKICVAVSTCFTLRTNVTHPA